MARPDEVRACCKKVIDGVAQDGGYIMDASAIMQNDTNAENLRAMTEFTREYGAYSGSAYKPVPVDQVKGAQPTAQDLKLHGMSGRPQPRIRPGTCLPWETKLKELPEITGDKDLARRIWEETDAFGNTFIWQCLLSF